MNNLELSQGSVYVIVIKTYRYQAIKQKEQTKLKIQMTRQLHEIRRHKFHTYT